MMRRSLVRNIRIGTTRVLVVLLGAVAVPTAQERCSHCHVGKEGQPLRTYDFVSDENPNKNTARAMLRELRGQETATGATAESE